MCLMWSDPPVEVYWYYNNIQSYLLPGIYGVEEGRGGAHGVRLVLL